MPGRKRVGITPTARLTYVDDGPLVIPDALVGLDLIGGQCFSRLSVVQCPQSAPGSMCRDCAMVELGENWENFKARTSSGVPKGIFYRRLNAEQERPDPDFVRALAVSRALAARG